MMVLNMKVKMMILNIICISDNEANENNKNDNE